MLTTNPLLALAIAVTLVLCVASSKMWLAAEKFEFGTCTFSTCAMIITAGTLVAGGVTIAELAEHGRERNQLLAAGLGALCATLASLWAFGYALLRREPLRWKFGTAILAIAVLASSAGQRALLEEGPLQEVLIGVFAGGWIMTIIVGILWLEAAVKQRKTST